MTKRRIHIDDFFRRGLGNMQMPVDGNDWAAMQAVLAAAQKRRKRRFLWLWMVGAGLLILGSAITFALVNPKEVTSTVTNPIPVTENTTPNTIPSTDNTANSITNTAPKVENKGQETGDNTTIDHTQRNTSPKNVTNKTPDNITGGNTKNKPGGDKENKTFTDKEDNNKTDIPNTPEPLVPEIHNNEDGNNNTTNTNDGTLPAQPSPEVPMAKQDSNVVEDKASKTQDSNDKKKPTDTGEKDKTFSPFSIGINIGPNLNTFGINNTTTYGSIRNNGDKAGIGYNGTVTLNYQLKNFIFSTGVGINSMGGSGRYKYTRQIYDSIPVYSPPPNPVIVGYFYQNFRDTSLNYNIENRFNYITFPASVAYDWEIGDKWGITTVAGIQLQRLVSASGEYINPHNLFKFGLGNDNSLLKKWNLNARAALGAYYKPNELITLHATFTYSRFAGSMLNGVNTAVLPRSIGFETGIKFNITK